MTTCKHEDIAPEFNLASGWDMQDRLLGFECACGKRWTVVEVEQALRLVETLMQKLREQVTP